MAGVAPASIVPRTQSADWRPTGGRLLIFLPFFSGLAAGLVHVLGAPDVVSMAPFSIEAGRQSWRVGLRWGIGHACGSIGIGLLAYAVRGLFEFERLRQYGDVLAGALLIGIGVWGLSHLRGHERDAHVHSHAPSHVHTKMALVLGMAHATFDVGNLALIAPVLTLATWSEAGAYLAGFGFGGLVAMLTAAVLVGSLVSGRGARLYQRAFQVVSCAALVLGSVWLIAAFRGVSLHTH